MYAYSTVHNVFVQTSDWVAHTVVVMIMCKILPENFETLIFKIKSF